MKGQLSFDEFMNIAEDKPDFERIEHKTLMADPCYYCLCNSCIYNAESITIHPDELPYDWNPCFLCDECRKFDSNCVRSMNKEECDRYGIDNYHAALKRKKFKVIS